MKIRLAKKEDTLFISQMIMTALHINVEENSKVLDIIEKLVEKEDTLYHWSRCRIAEESEKSVGICLAYDGCDYHERRIRSFDNQQDDESGPGEFYVDSLAVIPEMRGRGIGRMLVQNAVDRGKSQNLIPTILVDPKNTPAIRLYESVGFKGRDEIFAFGQIYWKMKA